MAAGGVYDIDTYNAALAATGQAKIAYDPVNIFGSLQNYEQYKINNAGKYAALDAYATQSDYATGTADANAQYKAESIVSSAISQYGAGTESTGMAIYNQAVSLGLSASQIAEATGQSVDAINSWIDQRNLDPLDGSHAGGLDYVPHDGYRAELHKGEAVISAPEVAAIRRYFGANVGGGTGNAELAAALRELADRLDRIEANTRATAGHSAGTNRKLDRVITNDSVTVRIAA